MNCRKINVHEFRQSQDKIPVKCIDDFDVDTHTSENENWKNSKQQFLNQLKTMEELIERHRKKIQQPHSKQKLALSNK